MPARDVMVVIGTRPEAIKMAPVIKALKARPHGKTALCVTAQHREMLDQALAVFDIKPDIDLNLMTPGQDLATLTARALTGMRDVFQQCRPDTVLVHGDTTTCFAASVAAYYAQIPIGHVEAGLRTYNLRAPFPEEFYRRSVDPLCQWCFAPTEIAARNLKSEHVAAERIFVTGNTAIDALKFAAERAQKDAPAIAGLDRSVLNGKRMVLVTGHRRENFGEGFKNICLALKDIADSAPDIAIVYPVHLNPNVQAPVNDLLGGHARIHLLAPQSYLPFVWLMQQSTLIITDSGGIQEEAPTLGKPVLVLRDETERPEAVRAGAARLVGTNRGRIVREATSLLSDASAYRAMASVRNPYGDGKAAVRIVEIMATK